VSQFARLVPTTTAVSVNHQGQFPAVTLSFNLASGTSLAQAVSRIDQATAEMGLPKDDPDLVPGYRAGLRGLVGEPTAADRGGNLCRLCRARDPLRKLYPPGDDPDESATGERRSAAGARNLRL